jgi:glycerol-3-phosphate dehydrogenase
MNRAECFQLLGESAKSPFDVLVIGGGATGLGIAVDAVTRGFRTALVEAGDFAQATSSRATKLVHGGVRYLASGQMHLVREALHERAVMMRNAPHLVHAQPFLLPAYKLHELPFYGAGLLVYDLLSGKSTMGPTRILGREATLQTIPNLQGAKLHGSVLYHDGQFNDARLALEIARTAEDHGAVVLNYARCARLIQSEGKLMGAVVVDQETGTSYDVRAKVVFNATGIFVDELRKMNDPSTPQLLTLSRGSHIVVGPEVLGSGAGIMVPKTKDGRVIFAIPWQGKVVVGTTDVSAPSPEMDPRHTENEIDFLLETINPFLSVQIQKSDILSVFSGLRPLVTGKGSTTSKISREHHMDVARSGLITIAGGKWTTYRRMAEDVLNFAADKGLLEKRACVTAMVPLHGQSSDLSIGDRYLREYGSDVGAIQELIRGDATLGERIDSELPYTFAQVVYAARFEQARTLEDVLSRRTRSLLLNSAAALRSAPRVADLLEKELGRASDWGANQVKEFAKLVRSRYSL